MMPQDLSRSTSGSGAPAIASAGSPCGSLARHVRVDFTRDVFLGGRRGMAVEADPEAQHRVGEAVALLPRHDQVDVLEPREVVLRRARRPAQPQRDLGQRQRLFLGEHVEDRLERAVAARAVQAQFVGEAAGRGDRAAGRQQGG